MPSQFAITESEQSQVIRTTQRSSVLEGLLIGTVVGGIFALSITHLGIGTPSAVLIFTVIGAFTLAIHIRPKHHQLRISSDEFILTGEGWREFVDRRVPSVTIRLLEYRDSSGDEHSYAPAGLYALLLEGEVCLLPEIEEQQVLTIIQKIYEKFPELRKQFLQYG